MKKVFIVILAAVMLTLMSAGSVSGYMPAEVDRDVVYCCCEDCDLALDFYYPESDEGLLPVIIYLHGGGWYSGDKTSEFGQKDIPELVSRGYMVVAVNYRLAPKYKFPCQIEDVRAAVCFLRSNAEYYGIDPGRIGVFGESAGGHLAALLGVTGGSCLCCGDSGCTCQNQSSAVQAVVDLFGPADLEKTFEIDRSLLMEHVFGTDDVESEIIKEASPVTWVSPDDPPFLIMHGDSDNVVLFEQSRELYDKLVAAGVEASLVTVQNAGHEFVQVGGAISPSRSEITCMIADFFDRYLK